MEIMHEYAAQLKGPADIGAWSYLQVPHHLLPFSSTSRPLSREGNLQRIRNMLKSRRVSSRCLTEAFTRNDVLLELNALLHGVLPSSRAEEPTHT